MRFSGSLTYIQGHQAKDQSSEVRNYLWKEYAPNNQAKRGNHPSWMWSCILEGRDLLQRHGRWVVASGNQIIAGKHNWLASGDNLKHLSLTEDIRVSNFMAEESRNWDPGKIRQLVPSQEAIRILQTPISWSLHSDKLQWPHTLSGSYTVKSGYHAARRDINETLNVSSSHNNSEEFWKVIWGLQAPQKIKHFIWRASTNVIAVSENLKRRRVIQEEAMALREAVQLAHNLQWPKCIFESDNIQVVSAARRDYQVWEIESIVQDVITLSDGFQLCGFVWVGRDGNQVANFIARACLRGSLPLGWVTRPPPPLKHLLHQDSGSEAARL
ncbi:Ribonuclease H-like superfamily, partial [Sesbania bispinosa]